MFPSPLSPKGKSSFLHPITGKSSAFSSLCIRVQYISFNSTNQTNVLFDLAMWIPFECHKYGNDSIFDAAKIQENRSRVGFGIEKEKGNPRNMTIWSVCRLMTKHHVRRQRGIALVEGKIALAVVLLTEPKERGAAQPCWDHVVWIYSSPPSGTAATIVLRHFARNTVTGCCY